MCDHDWYTHVRDYSGSGGWDDWVETTTGCHDGTFFHKCTKCALEENYQLYGLLTDVWGYGHKKFRGKLTIDECLAVLGLNSLLSFDYRGVCH